MAFQMKIAVGSDHAGFALKKKIIEYLTENGFDIEDVGTYSSESTDYPLYAFKVGEAVRDKRADFGVLVCYTGIGMSISANKVKGVRAALCYDVRAAGLARRHNDANIICLGANFIDSQKLPAILSAFLNNDFEGRTEGGKRHNRRVKIIAKYEEDSCKHKE